MKKFAMMAVVAALMPIVPAHAAEFIFDTTKAGTNVGTGQGNVMTYSPVAGTGLSMKATAWTLYQPTFWGFPVGGQRVSSSQLVSYSPGLGVVGDGESTSNNTHTIDNENGYDFILLQFSQAVTLTSANFNVYSVDGNKADGDATIGWGSLSGAWNQAIALDGATETTLDAMFKGTSESTGSTSGTRILNLSTASNLWMIGASQVNKDGLIDGFKLATITVATAAAVPEPATWAMMLVGFGMIGATARYRRRKVDVAFG